MGGGNAPLGEWTKVTCSLIDGEAKLSVNDIEVDSILSPGKIDLSVGVSIATVGNNLVDTGGSDPNCPDYGFRGLIDELRVEFNKPLPDSDNDGVPDGGDECPETPTGEIVDASGCSIGQICPCDDFRNHGQFVSCTARTAEAFVQDGLITELEADLIVSEAAGSACGEKSPKKGK